MKDLSKANIYQIPIAVCAANSSRLFVRLFMEY